MYPEFTPFYVSLLGGGVRAKSLSSSVFLSTDVPMSHTLFLNPMGRIFSPPLVAARERAKS